MYLAQRDGGAGEPEGAERSEDVLLWGMPADLCPAATGFYDVGVIHVQGSHSSPSHRGQADDFAAIFAPVEVLAPLLSARMEQQHAFACQGGPGPQPAHP